MNDMKVSVQNIMQKTIIKIAIAFTIATPAWADWVQLSESANGTVSYIDPSTIRKNGNFRKVWGLQNFRDRNSDGVMSMRALDEFDCIEERSRLLSISVHSEHMAEGVMLYSGTPPSDWKFIPPGSASAYILKIVCAK